MAEHMGFGMLSGILDGSAFMPPNPDPPADMKKSDKKRTYKERDKAKSADGRRWSTLDQEFTPPKKGEASFSGLPYAKQWMARKDIDRFILSVNDSEGTPNESAAPSKSTHYSPKKWTDEASYGVAHAADTGRSAKSGRSASSTGVEILHEGVHVPSDPEERRLDARCVLNLPGYRENKVRTLLFKNQELEHALKEEKANVRRLVRANDALEKQVLQLNASQNLPKSAPAVCNQVSNQSLWPEKNPESKGEVGQQDSNVQVIALESRVTRMNREISDLYQELQRCLAEQRRLEREASDAEKRRNAAEKKLEEREKEFEQEIHSLKRGEVGSDDHEYYSATSDSAESTPRGLHDGRGPVRQEVKEAAAVSVRALPAAEPPEAASRSQRQLSPSNVSGATPEGNKSHQSQGAHGGADVSETSFIASTPSPTTRRGAFHGGVCPLGLSICIGAGVCVCGEWEAQLERAEKQIADEQQRCAELGEQLNNQLTREIALESTLASLRDRCLNSEHVSEMLAKEAELGASLLEKKFDDANSSFASLERILDLLSATVQNVQESSVLQNHAMSRRISQRETEIQESAKEVATLQQHVAQLEQELSSAEKSRQELLKEKSQLAEQLEQSQESLASAQRSSRDLAAACDESQDKHDLVQRELQDSKLQADQLLAAASEQRMQLEAALRHEQDQLAHSHAMRDKAADELHQERLAWRRLEETLRDRIKAAELSKQELREALHEETSLSCSLREKLGSTSDQVPALNQEMNSLKAELAEAKAAVSRHEGAQAQLDREILLLREEAKKTSHKYHKKLKGLERANMTLIDSLREAKMLLADLLQHRMDATELVEQVEAAIVEEHRNSAGKLQVELLTISKLTSQLQDSRDSQDAVQRALHAMEQAVEDTESQLVSNKGMVQEMSRRLQSSQDQVHFVKSELEEEKAGRARERQEIEEERGKWEAREKTWAEEGEHRRAKEGDMESQLQRQAEEQQRIIEERDEALVQQERMRREAEEGRAREQDLLSKLDDTVQSDEVLKDELERLRREAEEGRAREQDLLSKLDDTVQSDEVLKDELERLRREAEEGRAREQDLLSKLDATVQSDEVLKDELERLRREAAEGRAREQDLLSKLDATVQSDEVLKDELERLRREAEEGRAKEQACLARAEEEEGAREREKEALLDHLDKENRRAAEMAAMVQKMSMEMEDREKSWAQEREELKRAGVERETEEAREKHGLQAQLLQYHETVKSSEEIIRQLEMHNQDLHHAWQELKESSQSEAGTKETASALARRAESSEQEAQRLRSELSEIISSLGDLSVCNARWLESHSAGEESGFIPRISAPLSLGVPGAPVYRTPVQAGQRDALQAEDSIVVMGSVIKGDVVPLSSAYKQPRALITPPHTPSRPRNSSMASVEGTLNRYLRGMSTDPLYRSPTPGRLSRRFSAATSASNGTASARTSLASVSVAHVQLPSPMPPAPLDLTPTALSQPPRSSTGLSSVSPPSPAAVALPPTPAPLQEAKPREALASVNVNVSPSKTTSPSESPSSTLHAAPPTSPWTPKSRRKGPLPRLEISVSQLTNMTARHLLKGSADLNAASVPEDGVYCRLRLNRETWHTDSVAVVKAEDGLEARWRSQSHTFCPDRLSREVHVAVLTSSHDLIGHANLPLSLLPDDVWDGKRREAKVLEVLTLEGAAVLNEKGCPTSIHLDVAAVDTVVPDLQ